MESTFSNYQAPVGLRSAHVQTLLPTLLRKRLDLPLRWERMELADGDFIDLAWYARSQAPLVLVMHGLEGSLRSHYATPLMQCLYEAGFSVVFMTLRGKGREPNRLPRSYHSGASADLAEVLQQLTERHQQPFAAVGISLSANLLLKYLGETGIKAKLSTAVAISAPFQLELCAKRLTEGFSQVYNRYLLNHLKASYREKFLRIRSPLAVDLASIKTLYQFDDTVTAPLNGFKDANDYYHRSSCKPFLKKVAIPTLVIHALDDPFMYPSIVPNQAEVSDSIQLEISKHGGHVGFMNAQGFWLDKRVPDYLIQQLRLQRHA